MMDHLVTNAEVVELFGGPGGSSQGLRDAGFTGNAVGIEWDDHACNTATAAGHHRLQADVSTVNPHRFAKVRGLIASPPCQGFSMSGKGKGRDDSKHLLAALDTVNTEADIVDAIARLHVDMTDDRSVFALEPLRFALALTPTWVMWEQVPAVLPIWEAAAAVLRRIGYTVDTGILQAEQYGVPQTRRRAILVAHAPWVSTPAKLPTPTHSRFHPRHPGKLDGGVQKWVSMAEALGWGMTERPSMTVTGGGTGKGGAEPFGNGARQGMAREMEAGRWLFAGAGATAQFTAQQRPRELTEPAHTITGKGTAAWIPSEARKRMGKGMVERYGDRPGRNVTEPSFTVRANAGGMEPGGFVWQGPTESRRVTVQEAAILQSFPHDYPWQGNKTAQYRQVGDAVPPTLAASILAPILEATDRDSPRAVAA